MNLDLVLILSGWLCAVIACVFAVRLFLQNKQMKAEIASHNKTNKKDEKDLLIPEDIDEKELAKGVIEFLDKFWDNPHMRARAEAIHKELAEKLKAWNDEE